MKISILVAVAENRVIGRDGQLPWHLPADLKLFKRLTVGHTVIMGRKTHESIVERLGKPLPKRRSLVLSRDPAYRPSGVEVATSLDQALELAAGEEEATPEGAEREVFVIGGAAVFAEALARADRLYLTRVHAEVDGDVLFPEIDAKAWRLISEERHEADKRHAYPFSFQVMKGNGLPDDWTSR